MGSISVANRCQGDSAGRAESAKNAEAANSVDLGLKATV